MASFEEAHVVCVKICLFGEQLLRNSGGKPPCTELFAEVMFGRS